MADLSDRAEVADELGVTTRTVQLEREDFPEPAKRIGWVRPWERTQIARWGKKTLPLPRPGRPPKS